MTDHLIYSVDRHIALLQLNRPAVLNAMNRVLYADLQTLLKEAAADENVRVLVVAGRGRAFCAGTDIGELKDSSAAEVRQLALLENGALNQLEDFPRPTIAAIHGYAVGGGCELALACDLRIAADNASMGQPEIDLGWLPAAGATFRLPALVGRAKARELIFSGRRIDAREAERIGLVEGVVPADDLMDQVMELARVLSEKDPFVMNRAVQALGRHRSREEAVELEAEILAECVPRPEVQEGIRAFLKRNKGT